MVKDLRDVLRSHVDREKVSCVISLTGLNLLTRTYGEQIIMAILHSKTAITYLTKAEQIEAEAAYGHSLSLTFVAASIFALITLITSLPTRERDLGERKIAANKKSTDQTLQERDVQH